MSNMELRGALADLHIKNKELDTKAGATIKAIKHLLNTAEIMTPIEDVDVEGAASLMAELIELKGEKVRNLGTIRRIEKELA